MILRGTPMLYGEGKRSKKLVVYHGGGGCGGQKVKVWIPDEKKVMPRTSALLYKLDGTTFDANEMVAYAWKHEVPTNMEVTTRDDRWIVGELPDYSNAGKLAFLMDQPEEEWGRYIKRENNSGNFGLACPQSKCQLRGSYVLVNGLLICKGYEGIEIKEQSEVSSWSQEPKLAYDPDTHYAKAQAKTMANLLKLVAAYVLNTGEVLHDIE